MERVNADNYHSRTTSITSTFAVRLKGEFPVGCQSVGDKIYSEPCGSGWRFFITHYSAPPPLDIYIDRHLAGSELENTVTVDVKCTSLSGELIKQDSVSASVPEKSPVLITSLRLSDSFEKVLLSLGVHFPEHQGPPCPPQPLTLPSTLSQALEASLSGDSFVDTKFLVFNRRTRMNTVDRPKPLFAKSSWLIPKAAYFETLLCGDAFIESADSDLFSSPNEMLYNDGDYDYLSDSDLEDEEENKDETSHSTAQRASLSRIPQIPLGRGRVVQVKDAAYTTWKALLFYLYTGSVPSTPQWTLRVCSL